MNRLLMTLALLIMPFVGLIGCSGEETAKTDEKPVAEMPEGMEAESDEPVETDAVAAEMVDGTQVITVKVTDMGYEPSRLSFKAGVPATIIFDQHGTTSCAWDVMSEDLGIALTDLPEGTQTEVSFTPDASGTYSFTCGMDMLKGSVIVEEAEAEVTEI